MLKVLLRPLAKSDIKKIWRYTYINWGLKQADKYASDLALATQAIAENPNIGTPIDEIREGYRLYHYKHHLLIYQESSTSIEIVRVLGESMDTARHI